jgi:hypothetical protein
MPQVFHRSFNVVSKVSIFASLFLVGGLIWVCLIYARSSYGSNSGLVVPQKVPFSHQHHVGVLGIDCRYCHTDVEHSSFAGIPPVKTCMNCHSQIWIGSNMLYPVRNAYRNPDKSLLRWQRVYNLPGFVYFDHSIHINKGIGCKECHGRIDEMPFTYQVPSLLMEWCLDCHRNPKDHLRPREFVFDMRWSPSDLHVDENGKPYPQTQAELGELLAGPKKYNIPDEHFLTSCSVCHR